MNLSLEGSLSGPNSMEAIDNFAEIREVFIERVDGERCHFA